MTDSGGALIGILKSFWPCCHTVKVSPLRGMQSQLKGVRRTSTHKPLILRRLLLCHGGTFLTWQPQAARLSAFAKDVFPAGPLHLRGRGEGRMSMKLQTKGNHKTNCGCPLKCKDWQQSARKGTFLQNYSSLSPGTNKALEEMAWSLMVKHVLGFYSLNTTN